MVKCTGSALIGEACLGTYSRLGSQGRTQIAGECEFVRGRVTVGLNLCSKEDKFKSAINDADFDVIRLCFEADLLRVLVIVWLTVGEDQSLVTARLTELLQPL